ncbi:hypothetical protein [Flavobacterium sp. NRK1]|uniref:hypothetical protein n=1 Tax=Flavobacterium sp. NRK1 TaxID=2954929 RepID=UPI0020921261|nr:hypothetical protein [Flavobacterium sp. NRK1]MCO6149570.1 hypothetical protein [Flavobacterium sp. NRK1]
MKTTNYLKKAGFTALALSFCSLTIVSCKKDKDGESEKGDKEIAEIKPQDFPSDLGIEGFNFPEDSTTIYTWLNKQDTVSITKHAWGIWAGLTAKTGQMYGEDSLYVFETWLGVKELADLSAAGKKDGGCTPIKKERTQLNIPRQFIHAQFLKDKDSVKAELTSDVFETVSYNPQAACHATKNLIFNQSELDKYKVKEGIGTIPGFPADAITTKPTYYAGKPDENGLIRVPVWPGTPNPAKVFGYKMWNTYVYADTKNRQPKNKVLVPVTSKTPTKEEIEKATCNVSDFINYKLDNKAAVYLNLHEDKGSTNFKAGDIVLLVAMHVGTKEISNWTWQTYFWSSNQNAPLFPSSSFEAGLMPAQVKGAAKHYAVSSAYAMVWPNQPINGGTNTNVKPIIAFNPYLEAGLTGVNLPNKLNPSYKYGVQTNCMACHAVATAQGNISYTTDQYISMDDKTLFTNQVQLDFAWSIQGNINPKK